jgi:cell division protease FtsH
MPDNDLPPKRNKPPSRRPDRKEPGKPTLGGRPGAKPPMMSRNILGWVLLAGLILVVVLMLNNANNRAAEVSYTEFLNLAQQDPPAFESVTLRPHEVIGELRDDVSGGIADESTNGRVTAEIFPQLAESVKNDLEAAGVPIDPKPEGGLLLTFLLSWGPILLIILIIYFFVFRAMRSAGGGPGGMLGNFGRSRHKMLNKEHSSVTLDDVAGIDEAKDEVGEIIEFLKNPKKFQRLGGRVPRGVLLIGQPGCGKTLLAKAVAGEADVPFFSISGSDFVEMFVGVGASRVRDLFKTAKDSAPCIIFLDEIDAVGRRRGSGFSSGGHDEREQTLNAILVEMDGFDSSDQVIVIASTNRADVLDPALTRPGRFDRQVQVPLPDIKGRMEILKVHSRKIKMSPDVQMEKLARGTPMFSGAELAAIINEAAIMATLQGKDFVEQDDLEEARDKVRYGRARKSHRIEEEEKKVIAYHEAGHATILYHDDDSDPLHKVTIIPRGRGLGAAFMLPEKDRHLMTRKQLLAQLRVTYGGRIAEDLFIGDISSGAAQDIRQATAIAKAMVTEYGMSERLGFRTFADDEGRQPWEQANSMSDDTAEVIDAEMKRIIDETYAQASELLEAHRDQVVRLAEALLKYETLTAEEVDVIMKGNTLDKATVADLLAAEKAKLPDEPTAEEKRTVEPDAGPDSPGVMPAPA